MHAHHMLQVFYLIFHFIFMTCCLQVKKFPLQMPNVEPDSDELYLCTPAKIVPKKNFYIVGFEPNATMDKVHHMILFGCTTPGTDEPVWDCGEMAMSESRSRRKREIPCAFGSHVIYAWARNAKTLELPEDVGFQVGEGTEIKYLVLQIHYSKKFPEGATDNSGLFMMYTEKPQSKLAGVLLLGTGGEIPPKSVTHMEAACEVNEGKTIHPFAYRIHTHSLGRVVSGYSVTTDEYGADHWTLLGKRDPLQPQMFYPVFNRNPIGNPQRIAARCTMDSSSRNDVTYVGPTNKHEMCNFYLMYYVENGGPLDKKFCMSEGPPTYSWKKSGNFKRIPDLEASILFD